MPSDQTELMQLAAVSPTLLAQLGDCPNIEFPTMGGQCVWDNIARAQGWKLQSNMVTGLSRIIDDSNIRRAWGSLPVMKEKFKRLTRDEFLEPGDVIGIAIKKTEDKSLMDKHSKNSRILDMYARLCEGKVINKTAEAVRFCVDERTIQRDIDDIRAFLSERSFEGTADAREIIYDRQKRGFVMAGHEGSLMSNSEILAVSKILLESRSFTKKEIGVILDKMIAGCVPQKNMKLVTDLIANEKYHYVELHHRSRIKDKLWELGTEIKQCNLLEIEYEKQTGSKHTGRPGRSSALHIRTVLKKENSANGFSSCMRGNWLSCDSGIRAAVWRRS